MKKNAESQEAPIFNNTRGGDQEAKADAPVGGARDQRVDQGQVALGELHRDELQGAAEAAGGEELRRGRPLDQGQVREPAVGKEREGGPERGQRRHVQQPAEHLVSPHNTQKSWNERIAIITVTDTMGVAAAF